MNGSGNVGIGTTNPASGKLQVVIGGDASGITLERTAGGFFTGHGFASSNPYFTYYANTQFVIGYGTSTGAAPTLNTLILKNTGQAQLPQYTSTTSFTGTAAGVLAFDSSGNLLTIATPSGGTPGGANTTIQFNDAGAFSGSGNFTFTKATNTVKIQGSGSTLLHVTGSSGDLFSIVDSGSNFPIIATFSSGSVNLLTVTTSSVIVTGSFTVVTGSSTELQVTNTGVRIGSIITDSHPITGSLNVTGSQTITGSLNVGGIVSASSYQGSGASLTGIVTQIVAGTNVTISPVGGTGVVTINSSGGGGGSTTGSILLTAAGGWPSLTNGCQPPQSAQTTTNQVNFYYLGFPDGATTTFANWAIPMPADYNGGTITAVFYWVAGNASTNSVVWGLAARAYADSDVLDQAFGTQQQVTDANQANDDVNISAATPAITIGGTPAAGNFVQFRANRDPANASDTLAATAELLAIRITYTRV